ncbi:MAG: 30S ribosomal protein S11 [Candidatus Omnitrophica bacterium]|nr:30S ribosomal protein S11 [Candidatus Omnitrophota bacterium]
MQKAPSVRKKKKLIKKVPHGKIFVHSTFNNTIVTITDLDGKILCWSSGGCVGFKGSRKSTPFAANIAAKDAVKKSRTFGVKDVDIFLKGPGGGKESAVRSIKSEGLNVKSVLDVTPSPHNGCRPRKKRRV